MSSYLAQRLAHHDRITVHPRSQLTSATGEKRLSELTWRDEHRQQDVRLEAGWAVPDDRRRAADRMAPRRGRRARPQGIRDDPGTFATSVPGLFAVGDVRAGSVKRVASAVGEGSVVVSAVHAYLAGPGDAMILVTGGFGSIGAHTALALADLGEQVVVTRRRKAAPPSFLEGRVAVEQADLADLDALRAIGDRHEITGIVHLAAVALEEPDAIAFMRRNTAMLLNVLEVARTLEGAALRGGQQHRRLPRHPRPALARGPTRSFRRRRRTRSWRSRSPSRRSRPRSCRAPASSRSSCASARSGGRSAFPTRRSSRSRGSSRPPCAARPPT